MTPLVRRLTRRINVLAGLIAVKLAEYGVRSIADIRHVSIELRAEIWNKFIGRADPRIEKMRKTMAGLFRRQFAEVMENVRKNPPPLGKAKEDLTDEQMHFISLWLFDREKWRQEFMDAGNPQIRGALVVGGQSALDTLGIAATFVTDAAVETFIMSHVFTFAEEIGKTSADALTAQFVEALKGGESVTDMMDRIQTVMKNATGARARLIAQTEMIGAINKGMMEGDRQSGVVWGHQWIGQMDERIRETHEEMTVSEEAVPMGARFSNGCEYPGDQEHGDASEVCNCLPGYVYVNLPNKIEKIMKREYHGKLITITTSIGNILTATPNHPVFTPDGWVPLKLIEQGSDIFCGSFGKKIPFVNPNINKNPARIDKVFDAISSKWLTGRTAGTDMDFHGDGEASNIDIIFPDSLLENTRHAKIGKPIKHNFFTGIAVATITGFLIKFSPLFQIIKRSLFPAHRIMGFSRKTLSFFWRSIGHTNIHSLTTIPGSDSVSEKSVPNNISADFQGIRQRLLRFSGEITTEKIIDVKTCISDRGISHVYNLQTKNGWYIANNITSDNGNVKGFIVHNCRCTIKPLTEGPNGEKPGQ